VSNGLSQKWVNSQPIAAKSKSTAAIDKVQNIRTVSSQKYLKNVFAHIAHIKTEIACYFLYNTGIKGIVQ
jgi:hypothetical protein